MKKIQKIPQKTFLEKKMLTDLCAMLDIETPVVQAV